MPRRLRPPLPGGEHTFMFDTGPQPVPPGATRVRLIPVGDGGPGTPAPPPFPRRRTTPLVPTPDEVADLPDRAYVAFAARCARRVQHVAPRYWPDMPTELAAEVERAVTAAEQAAAAGAVLEDAITYTFETAFHRAPYHVPAAARCAVTAAFAAAHAAALPMPDTFAAVQNAVEALLYAASEPEHVRAFRRDFARLRVWGRAAGWTHDTPIPPDVFGPLWPRGGAPVWARERRRPRA